MEYVWYAWKTGKKETWNGKRKEMEIMGMDKNEEKANEIELLRWMWYELCKS